jgi:hypothetical protein
VKAVLAFRALAVLAVGCAGELQNPERFADCPPGFVEELFMEKCAGECHAGAEPEAGLDLVSPGAAERMVGATSVQESCAGLMIVDPGGENSLLVEKLGDAPPCGARMPFGETKLDAAEVECVRRWVDEVVAAGGGGS